MMQFHEMIAKLLDNPLSLPILQLLTKKQMSIPQITKSLGKFDTDMPTVIAVLGELYYFGLVERVSTPIMDSSPQEQINSRREENNPFLEYRLISPTPLGIPLHNYVSLWEESLQHPDQINFDGMNNWIFSIPQNLREEMKDLTLEEIREKLLNRG
jgi:hypothetical protein